MIQVVFSNDGGSVPYILGWYRNNDVRDSVEQSFPPAFFEGCLFHAFFSAKAELRNRYQNEVGSLYNECALNRNRTQQICVVQRFCR